MRRRRRRHAGRSRHQVEYENIVKKAEELLVESLIAMDDAGSELFHLADAMEEYAGYYKVQPIILKELNPAFNKQYRNLQGLLDSVKDFRKVLIDTHDSRDFA